jgi:hypothetical protein
VVKADRLGVGCSALDAVVLELVAEFFGKAEVAASRDACWSLWCAVALRSRDAGGADGFS